MNQKAMIDSFLTRNGYEVVERFGYFFVIDSKRRRKARSCSKSLAVLKLIAASNCGCGGVR